MSSTTVVTYPIGTALMKAEDILGPDRTWHTVNSTQRVFLEGFFTKAARVESRVIPEIESIASWEAEVINQFLRERGFAIQLAPFSKNPAMPEFGVASVLDLLIKWLHPGRETTLKLNSDIPYTTNSEEEYPAVRMAEGMSYYTAQGHPYAIAKLQTQSQDVVYMTRLDVAPTGFALLDYVKNMMETLAPNYDYKDVIFPMVALKQKVDISWLLGLNTVNRENKPVAIVQALQETHLSMDAFGAHAKSAVALGFRVMASVQTRPKPNLVIDGPMLVWCERPSLSKPLFVGHITPEDWKKPAAE